jgi:hypothetical protein
MAKKWQKMAKNGGKKMAKTWQKKKKKKKKGIKWQKMAKKNQKSHNMACECACEL